MRSFDQLALLLPGVAPPPQTLGSVAGPGVGSGVGTAGQFAVNGLRSRANNFTVDGSDNNDEDIGVRRQGFFALVPQSIESIREYQVTTLLAPAQFGRNIGAQVNAVSKSGTSEIHGTVYGFLNSSQLNARNFFDSTGGESFALRAGNNQPVIAANDLMFDTEALEFVPINGAPVTVQPGNGDKDSLTFGNGGFVLGGPIVSKRMFFFISAEGQILNATREANFAVPTLEERGIFNGGAAGIFNNPFTDETLFGFPSTQGGDAIFSLFPLPNNPNGVYGVNTLTQTLPDNAKGAVASAKYDANFKVRERLQSVTARYNFTQDARTIPVTGGALFSSLRPRVRTQNFSFFFNSELSASDSPDQIFNQVRLSYGRTRLNFREVRDTSFLLPSETLPGTPFLLNARLIQNLTLPDIMNGQVVPNSGAVVLQNTSQTVEDLLGAVGQVSIAGFSPVGVDVFNFPQRRINNTYQLADQLTYRRGTHNFAFGIDTRRTELNSDLARNSRPLITFNGAPGTDIDDAGQVVFSGDFFSPAQLAAASAASGFFQTISNTGEDAGINLRFYQLNFYGQDEWRVRPNLSFSYGLRYEYNTPAREVNRQIENTFDSAELALVPGLEQFIAERTKIFDSDRNNFAPRIGLAYAPNFLRRNNNATVIRLGYGLFYDQIPGAVVSQSRSVFPRFLTVNLAGGAGNLFFPLNVPFSLLSPSSPLIGLVAAGTLNTRNPDFTLADQVAAVNILASAAGELSSASGVEITLPARELGTPKAHHYSISIERQLNANTFVSAAYVGTQGRNLLRFTTPNLGSNAILLPDELQVPLEGDTIFEPRVLGIAVAPGTRLLNNEFVGGRPLAGVGGVSIFDSSASSRYDSLQLQVRGRLQRRLQYQANYTFSKTIDDVSDVFDLAGASSLPQNSLAIDERGFANFDARHRFAYNFIYDFGLLENGNRLLRSVFDGMQLASIGRFQTGQPFTVNSIFDVNLDGNLTDRLDSTEGIVITGDSRQPLRLTTADTIDLLAQVGEDGQVGRNTFRAGNILELDLAVMKNIRFAERYNIQLRAEVFNFINRANFGIPVRFLEAPGFGQAISTVTPARRVQFGIKYNF